MLKDQEKRILAELQINGRASNVELAKKVGLSETPCHRRVKQLEDAGIIERYVARLDQRKVGMDVTAFIQVHLDQRSEAITKKFHRAVEQEPSIIECYAMSGSFDYLVKVVAKDIDAYSDIAMKRILRFPGVKDITSTFLLKTIKSDAPLPL